jgi:hypothetical protein
VVQECRVALVESLTTALAGIHITQNSFTPSSHSGTTLEAASNSSRSSGKRGSSSAAMGDGATSPGNKTMTMDRYVFDGTFDESSCCSPIGNDMQDTVLEVAVETPPNFNSSNAIALKHFDHSRGRTTTQTYGCGLSQNATQSRTEIEGFCCSQDWNSHLNQNPETDDTLSLDASGDDDGDDCSDDILLQHGRGNGVENGPETNGLMRTSLGDSTVSEEVGEQVPPEPPTVMQCSAETGSNDNVDNEKKIGPISKHDRFRRSFGDSSFEHRCRKNQKQHSPTGACVEDNDGAETSSLCDDSDDLLNVDSAGEEEATDVSTCGIARSFSQEDDNSQGAVQRHGSNLIPTDSVSSQVEAESDTYMCSDSGKGEETQAADFTISTRISKLSMSRRRQRGRNQGSDAGSCSDSFSSVKVEARYGSRRRPRSSGSGGDDDGDQQASLRESDDYGRGYQQHCSKSSNGDNPAVLAHLNSSVIPETPPSASETQGPSSDFEIEGCNRKIDISGAVISPARRFQEQLSQDSEVLRWAMQDCNSSGARQGVSFAGSGNSSFTGCSGSEDDDDQHHGPQRWQQPPCPTSTIRQDANKAEKESEDFHFTQDESFQLSKPGDTHRRTRNSSVLNHSSLAAYSISFNRLHIQTDSAPSGFTPAETETQHADSERLRCSSQDHDDGTGLKAEKGANDREDVDVDERYRRKRNKAKKEQAKDDLAQWMKGREKCSTVSPRRGHDSSAGGILVSDDAQYPLASSATLQVVLDSWKASSGVGPTLIITTPKNLDHWLAQVRTTSLAMYAHHGSERRKQCSQKFLASFDVVLTTYDRLKAKECWHTVALPPTRDKKGGEDGTRHPLRPLGDSNTSGTTIKKERKCGKNAASSSLVWRKAQTVAEYNEVNVGSYSKSFLHRVYWNRIVLDDARLIGNKNTARSKATYALQGLNRWCIGTTLKKEEKDLHCMRDFILHAATSAVVPGLESEDDEDDFDSSDAVARNVERLSNLEELVSKARFQ